MNHKGAIFDMDGLLFDTEKIFQQTWNEIAEERKIQLSADFAKAISGTSGSHMQSVIEKYYGVADGSTIQHECIMRVAEKLKEHVPKKPGVCEILEFFKANGFRIAVASSSTKKQIENNLEIADIRSYFDAVVSGNEVKNGKPAPDIFLYAAEKIGCKPQDCYVFEDSQNGIRAGFAAGCKAIMIPDMIAPTEEMYRLSYRIYDSLSEARISLEKLI